MMASAAPEGAYSPKIFNGGIKLKSLTINHSIYAGNETRGGYRVMSAELNGNRILTDIANPQVVGFIEQAIEEAIKMAIASGEQSISINVSLPSSITLSDDIAAHISAKYEADPVVNSISFNV